MDSRKKPHDPLLSKLIVALITVLVTVAAIKLAGSFAPGRDSLSVLENIDELRQDRKPGGYKLRRLAWESSFAERGLDVPPRGPREGLRGEWVTPLNCAVADCDYKKSIPGIIETDENGIQSVGNAAGPYPHILIVGGSVAWGAGASDIANTYFSKLHGMLKNEYPDTRISVLAAYGSTGNTDLSHFVMRGLDMKPDIVLFLNGLNDLTVEGSVRQSDVSDYVLSMKVAGLIARRNGIPAVIIRQPFPGGKRHKTELEKRILELSNENYEGLITPLYNHLGNALHKLSKTSGIYYIDAADCFEDERATTFNDQWHFSDPGHELLAERIYAGLAPILSEILGKGRENPD